LDTTSTFTNTSFENSMKLKGKFGSMIACFCYYPLTSNPEDNLKLLFEEQMNQWYCMDVLSKGEYPYYSSKFFESKNITLNITDEDKKVLVGFNGIDGKEVTMSELKNDINEIRDSKSTFI